MVFSVKNIIVLYFKSIKFFFRLIYVGNFITTLKIILNSILYIMFYKFEAKTFFKSFVQMYKIFLNKIEKLNI